jgi:hypothetical protein
MKGKDEIGLNVAEDDFQTLRQALRRMPTPEPRAGFVERALAQAAAPSRSQRRHPLPGACVPSRPGGKPGRVPRSAAPWRLH